MRANVAFRCARRRCGCLSTGEPGAPAAYGDQSPAGTTKDVPCQGKRAAHSHPASYPREALQQQLQGKGMLYVVVGPDGVPVTS